MYIIYIQFYGTWAHDAQLHIAGTNEPKTAQQANRKYNISGHK